MAAPKKAHKRTTIADVARLAGVGAMTVSRTINGHPYVSDAVARRVQAAIRKLNYRPNVAAQMLNGRPSSTIGLVLPDLRDPFFAALTHSVQQTAREHHYQVWVAASNSDDEVERMEVEDMVARAVDGLLLVPARSDVAYLRQFSSWGVPMVAIDRFPAGSGADSVEVENAQGSRVAVEHLIAHRRRRILCFGYDGAQPTIGARVQAYRAAMKMAKLSALVHVSPQSTPPSVAEACRAIEQNRPDAIFATNNLSTLRALEALHQMRLRVPRQVALIGFDDVDPWRVVAPSVTAIRQPVHEMGTLAVRILLDRIKNRSRSAVRTILPVRLMLRASCGCVDPAVTGAPDKLPGAAIDARD
jgi:LacI family transcriptional regulator